MGPGYDRWAVQRPRVSPRAYLVLAQSALALVVLNIVSGAAVRLTDSGLGCPDWPTCSRQSITPALAFHPDVEFANRMVVVVLCVAAGLLVLAAWWRTPRRRDLIWLSGLFVAGVLGEAVLGAVVVYSKLNPYAVMTHFMVGIALLSAAVVLVLRLGRSPEPGRRRVGVVEHRVALGLIVALGLAVAAGTATTGAGPHAGGKGAVRLPVPLSDMARTHSGLVLVAGALLLFELFLLDRARTPGSVQQKGRVLLVVAAAQGVIGYTQYFTHLPAALVAVHVFGATAVWIAALWFYDGLVDHAPEVLGHQVDLEPRAQRPEPAGAVPA